MAAKANEINADVQHAIKVLAEAMGLEPDGPLGDLKFLAEEAAARLAPHRRPNCPECGREARLTAYLPYCSQICLRA